MPKLTKRVLDALQHDAGRDVFVWDTEVRGFGVRLKPSGTKTFLIQYRNAERRTRRFVIGQYGVLTVDVARDLARKKLASVIDGGDPSEERRAAREGMTVAEVCDWYIDEAGAAMHPQHLCQIPRIVRAGLIGQPGFGGIMWPASFLHGFT